MASTARFEIREVVGAAGPGELRSDALAVEQALEMRIRWPEGGTARERVVAVTMRTPGHDAELTAGYLYTEGIVADRKEIVASRVEDDVCILDLAEGVRAGE